MVGPAPKPMDPEPVRQPQHTGSSRTSLLRTFLPPTTPQPASATPTEGVPEAVAPPGIGVAGSFSGANPIAIGRLFGNATVAPPPKPVVERPKAASEPLRVTSSIQMAKLIRKVIPIYPPLAKQLRLSGVVRLIGTIAKDGTITNLQLVSGHPILAHAAIEAVEQWVYQPTLLNGEPVEVIAPIEVSFTLSQ